MSSSSLPRRLHRGRHRAVASVLRYAHTLVVAAIVLVLAQAGVSAVFGTSVASAAVPGNGSAFDCYGDVVYNVQRGVSGGTGSINALDTTTFGNATVTATHVTDLPSESNPNALAITQGGAYAFSVRQTGASGSVPLYKYTAANGGSGSAGWESKTGSGSTNTTAPYVAGAYDPKNDVYYYAQYDIASRTATIYGYQVGGDSPISGVVATVNLPLPDTTGNVNGDMAFDQGGNLYLVESVGTNAAISVVAGGLPNTGNNATVTATTLHTYANPNGRGYNGMAFDNYGRLYLEYTATVSGTTSTYLVRVNPNTDNTLPDGTQQGLATTGLAVDLAACSLNPTVTVKTNVGGRSLPGDQFTMSVTGSGVTQGNTATTSGSATGTQTQFAGPVIGVSGDSYTIAIAPTQGSLARYTVAYSCVDSAPSPNRTIASGTIPTTGLAAGASATFPLNFPNPAAGATGPYVTCTFAVDPSAARLDTKEVVQSVNGDTSATVSTPLRSGDQVVYGISVTNPGGTTGTTTVTETIPANTTYTGTGEGWTCTGTTAGSTCTHDVTVTPGSTSAVYPFTVTVGTLPSNTTSIRNDITTSTGTCSVCSLSNPTIGALDNVLTIYTVNGNPADASTQLKPGDVVVYRDVTTNTGGSSATTTLSNPVPANTTYNGTGQGWSCSNGAAAGTACTQSVTVPSGGSVTNYYTVKLANPLPTNVSTITDTVTSSTGTCSACSVSNTVAAALSTGLELTTVNGSSASPATQVKQGDVLGYSVTVTNASGTAGSTTITETVPANTTYTGTGEGWTCTGTTAGSTCTQVVNVPGGTSVVKPFTVTVGALPPNTTAVSDTITSSTGSCTGCTVSNATVASLDTVEVVRLVNGNPATSATPVGAGDVVTYRVTVTNTGGSSGSTTLTDVVPGNATYTGTGQSWSCATNSPAGTSCSQSVTVGAGAAVTRDYTVTIGTLPANTLSFSDSVTSSQGTCSSCSATNPTKAVLDTVLTLTSVNGSTAVNASTPLSTGDVVVYTATSTNTGGTTATNAVSETVPAHTTYTGSGEGWSCANGSAAGTACNQTISVPAAGSTAVTYTVTVGSLPGGTLTVADSVTASTGSCSSCSVSNPTVARIDTTLTIDTVNGNPASTGTKLSAGDVVTYQVSVTNSGGTNGSTVVTVTVPANTTYTGIGEGWTCTGTTAGSTCTQTIPAGANSTTDIPFTVTVDSPLPDGTTSITTTAVSNTGSCSNCVATNATVGVLDTTLAVATVNGQPADSTTPVKEGDVVVYRVTVANAGGTTATTTVTETVPAHTTYTGAVGEGWTCSDTDPGSTCTQAVTVPQASSVTVEYTVTVGALPANTTTVPDTITTSKGTCSQCTTGNPTVSSLDTSEKVTSVQGQPATSATPVAAGDTVVYTITVKNSGGSSGTTIVTVPTPAHSSYSGNGEGWTCDTDGRCTQSVTVASGDTATITYTVTVDNPLAVGTQTVDNPILTSVGTCSVCTVSNPTAPVFDTVKDVVTVNGDPATTATAVQKNDEIFYRDTVTNTGGTSGQTMLTETVPANTTYTGTNEGWTCTGTTAGSTCTQTVTVAANSANSVGFTVTVGTIPPNTASITDTVTSSFGTCSSCTVSNPTTAALVTSKTLSRVNGQPAGANAQLAPGDVAVYAITVANQGGSTGSALLGETVPLHTTYTGTGEGWSCFNPQGGSTCDEAVTVNGLATTTVYFTVTVDASLPVSLQSIDNTVAVSAGQCSSCTVTTATVGSLSVSKAVAKINGVTATNNDEVKAGDVVTYAITAANTGGSSVTTTLSDPVPANATYTGAPTEGWSCVAPAATGTACTQSVTVAANTTVVVSYTMTVASSLPKGTAQIANVLTSSQGTCTSCSPTSQTVAALDTTKRLVEVNGQAVTGSVRVKAGDVLGYVLAVTNTGGSPSSTTLTEHVPAHTAYTGTSEGWTCDGATCTQDVLVGAQSGVTKTFTVTVDDKLPSSARDIVNKVDTSAGSCSACTVSTTLQRSDLVVTKTADTTAVSVGDTVTFTVRVHNNGPDTATDVLVVDHPTGLKYKSSSAGQGTFDAGTGQWEVGDIADGKDAVLKTVYEVTSTDATNTARAVGPQVDPSTPNGVDAVNLHRPDASPSSNDGDLASTGVQAATLLGLGVLLIVGGVVLTGATRRRRRA